MNQNWHYIFSKKSLRGAYGTSLHSLSTIKINYSTKMKISLSVFCRYSVYQTNP